MRWLSTIKPQSIVFVLIVSQSLTTVWECLHGLRVRHFVGYMDLGQLYLAVSSVISYQVNQPMLASGRLNPHQPSNRRTNCSNILSCSCGRLVEPLWAGYLTFHSMSGSSHLKYVWSGFKSPRRIVMYYRPVASRSYGPCQELMLACY
jgi:hypothetical protein